MADDVADLQEALQKIAAIALAAKSGRNDKRRLAALNDIADITDEFLCDDEDEEAEEWEEEP